MLCLRPVGAWLRCFILPVLDTPPTQLPPDLDPSAFTALYVHVPFCFHKCHYCDFYSITRQTPERMAGFVDLLLAEAAMWPGTPPLSTVFFGGGTPTLLPAGEMARLLDGLREAFDLSGVTEFTVEANPATVDADYCRVLRDGGVDRLSFGAQSFDPAALQMLERHHDPDDVERSVDAARSAGFTDDRLSIDLIFGVPGQPAASWAATLERGIAIGTGHMSCYGLTYESNTPLDVRRRLGRVTPVAEDLELELLRHTRRRLTDAGLPPYEISNYGTPSAHNLTYWRGGSYLGLGPSAASHAAGVRWKNAGHLGKWERAVAAGSPPVIEAESLDDDQRAEERVMLGLRLAEGVAGVSAAVLTRAAAVPHLVDVDGDRLTLTDAGVEVADAVVAHLLS